jgi:hypothetical protein
MEIENELQEFVPVCYSESDPESEFSIFDENKQQIY